MRSMRALYTSENCWRLSTKTEMRSSHTAHRIICSLESATSWNHQVGGLPWARYSVDELIQQAKAGDRPYPGDPIHLLGCPPDEDFHWTRQISSWTLPGLLGMFGHSYTLRQLGESGRLCHCCRALGSGARKTRTCGAS